MRPRSRLFPFFLLLALAGLTWLQLAGVGRVLDGPDSRPAQTEREIGRPGPPARGTLRVGIWQAPAGTFHPLLGGNAADTAIGHLLHASLLRLRSDLRLEPYLARAYLVSPDQRVIAFVLDEGARWQDGRPVTARDAVRTVEVALRRKSVSPDLLAVQGAAAFVAGKATAVAGLRPVGDRVLLVRLERPWGPSLTALATLPLLRSDHRGAGPPPASGPFALARAVKDRDGRLVYVELAANKGFVGRPPGLKTVEYVLLQGRPTVRDLRQLRVDVVDVRPEYASLLGRNGFRLVEVPRAGYYYVGFNLYRAPLHDRRFREAVAHAVDTDALIRILAAGRATPLAGPVYPGSWAEAPASAPTRADPVGAGRLLSELGYTDRDGDGILDKDGRPLVLNLAYAREDPTQAALAAVLARQLRAAGMRVFVHDLERNDFLRLVFRRRNFDLYLASWRLGADPTLSRFFAEDAAANAVAFRAGRLEQLLKAADATVDPARREVYYRALTGEINRELPYLFLFAPNQVVALSGRVRGYWPGPGGWPAYAERWLVAS